MRLLIEKVREQYPTCCMDVLSDNDRFYQTLIFRDALGLEYSIALYEGGYVQETVNGTKLIARIDEELCRRVMERIEAYKTENYEVSYEGAIPVDGK